VSVAWFAFGAGVLATVNPCGIVMLPAFLAFCTANTAGTGPRGGQWLASRLGRGLTVGLAVSAGFAAVFAAAGLLVAVGLRQVVQGAPLAAVLIGAVLAVLGLMLVAGRQIGLRLGTAWFIRGRANGDADVRGWQRMMAFGAGYRSRRCPARSRCCWPWWRRPPPPAARRR
jgi:cytochrome c-type biogenesis protein